MTDEQIDLTKQLKKWFYKRNTPYYSYSGPAGSGKTTVIKNLIDELHLTIDSVAACAYVGKAVLTLLRHGLRASTIHSLIYKTFMEVIKDPDGNSKMKLSSVLNTSLDPKIKLIVVDEATMVNDKMRDDLLSFDIPVIFIGDMNQLPPVFGISSVMREPDFILTKIMRQAEDDPIIYLSQRVLHDEPLLYGEYGKSSIINQLEMSINIVKDYDCIICSTNKTRESITTYIRENILHFPSNRPIIGDKLICRQNNWDLSVRGIALTNGLIGFLRNIDKSTLRKGYALIDFQPDFMDGMFENVEMDYRFINLSHDEKKEYGLSSFNKFEYGYVVTCHLVQGSEFNRVLYLDEPKINWSRELRKKLRYTAITRATESITIVLN